MSTEALSALNVSDPTVLSKDSSPTAESLTRRRFLRGAAVAGGGLVVAGIAACAPTAGAPTWTYGPPASPGTGAEQPSAVASAPTPSGSHDHTSPAPSGSAPPADHDAAALAVVKRFLDGEHGKVEGAGNQPFTPKVDGGVKVFDFTVDKISHLIDAQKPAVAALGFNGTWPGPRLDVIEGDTIRAVFTNKLDESTGIHFHGQQLPNKMDGVPHITQDPIKPGDSFTYEFAVRTVGSHMYHSHHNATDQVGRGLLGAFIVHPKDPALRYDKLYGVTQDIVWISNDTLGGFTINGRGFPATAPIVAKVGEKIVVRFMNEGIMTHPWHLHGQPMHIVARDGYPLGSAAFYCDTLGVNPGERWDAVIDCQEPGAWAFHCHILPHAEGQDGMFGMVTALVIQDATAAGLETATGATPVVAAAAAAGSSAFLCQISATG
ncbi:MAG TPA: multicopper oxidase domain-containing protein [Candidatus Limnocylindrales bacterium]|jgi:FtsP/CotA-like multicopper oxidase with cupredoxin domain